MTTPIRVAVTGAAGSICYSLLFRIAAGEVFGPDQPVILQLVEIPPAMKALEGTVMEINDCAFDTLAGIEMADNPMDGFKDANVAILVGGRPRGPGMVRADLIKMNGPIFVEQGKALNVNAAEDIRVCVVGNPCNTNALIAQANAPDIEKSRFTAMTRLDQNRSAYQLANKAGVSVNDISNITIFGNHSNTMYPDIYNATIKGKPVVEVISDHEWLKGDFISTIQGRGKAIINARGKSSAASAGNAALEHVRDWYKVTPKDSWVNMAVTSDGSYGIKAGLIYSMPVRCDGAGSYEIVQGLEINDFAKEKMKVSEDQLLEERSLVEDLLK